ncbi:hypothetical protein AAKU64_003499 [Undibacterium sp. GrIS 1.8]|uniref:hypothetical protein n=1 Tax=Undibacterium sp. GrIS 1.8 TaxID=3143934 RepID=UPI00339A6B7F
MILFEYAAGRVPVKRIFEKNGTAVGKIVDTGKNFSCHSYFKNMGFSELNGLFYTEVAPANPTFIKKSFEDI